MMGFLQALKLFFIYTIGLFWSTVVVLRCLQLLVTKPRKFLARKNRKVRPTCLDDPQFGSHNFTRSKDIRMHYVASGDSNKPLMLFLHGFPEFWYSWRHQIKEFQKEYRVVAVDLRGYGETDKPTAVSDYTLDKLVDDIRYLIPALGYKACTVVGHDWGGAITWSLAASHPELIEKVVILNCPHISAFTRHIFSSWKQLLKSWYMFVVNLPYFPEWFFASGDKKMLDNAFCGKEMGAKKGAFSSEDMEAFKYNFNRIGDFTGPMNYIRAALRQTSEISKKKVPEGVPVLLLWGTRDGALSIEMAELSRDYAADFRLKFIEGASHWVQQDEPDVVNSYIWKFLKDLPL